MVATMARRTGERRVRLSSFAMRLTQLESPACIQSMPPVQRRSEIKGLLRARRTFDRITCSAAWFDTLWAGVPSKQYPPGGDDTLMINCPDCERFVPVGPCGGKRICYECWLTSQPIGFLEKLPSSPGIIDMARLAKNAKPRDR